MEDNKRLEQGFDDSERQVIKRNIVHFTDTSEIKHFAEVKVSQNDNVYGVTWAELVRNYLKTAYSEENTQAEIISFGVTYKVLRRGKVTVFYDAGGNTLFDVENTRLEKEYAWIMKDEDYQNEENKEILPENMDTVKEMNENVTEVKEGVQPEKNVETLIENLEKSKEAETVTKTVPDDTSELEGNVKEQARQKLEEELKKAEEKNFADPVIMYLLKRCEEDSGLAADVMQKHKTWKKCFNYIYAQARKQSKGNCAAVRDDVVYEWAEDYYHKDDKAEEEKKAKKEAEAKAKREKAAAERKTQAKEKSSSVAAPAIPKKEDKRKDQVKKNSKDMEGQLDMFSMMGM